MKRYILTLLAIISLIAVSATNQTSQKNGTQTSPEVDELLSEDEVLSGNQKNEDKIRPDSIGIDIPDFLRKLDEIYDAPTLLTWFQDAYKMNGGISIRPVELTNMYTGNKYYRLLFKVERDYGNASRLVSTEETISIIDGLKRISEYINKSFIEEPEEISYCKKLSQNVREQISFWFEYDANDYKWKGSLSLINVTSWFDNVIRDLPQFIELLKQGVNTLEARMVNGDFYNKLQTKQQEDGQVSYFWDGNMSHNNIPITPIEDLAEKIYNGIKYFYDKKKTLNKKLEIIIKENSPNPNIESLGKYGYADIVWNSEGSVVSERLVLTQDAEKQISERTIKIILNKIREFKIEKYKTAKGEESEYIRIIFTLEMAK
jgi:hypothetical protein